MNVVPTASANGTRDVKVMWVWEIQSRILECCHRWTAGYFAASYVAERRASLAAELRAIADELDPGPGAPSARLLTAREVAGMLGVTPDWVRARARDWPFARRIGRWWRFEAEGVRRWTETQTERRRRASGG